MQNAMRMRMTTIIAGLALVSGIAIGYLVGHRAGLASRSADAADSANPRTPSSEERSVNVEENERPFESLERDIDALELFPSGSPQSAEPYNQLKTTLSRLAKSRPKETLEYLLDSGNQKNNQILA